MSDPARQPVAATSALDDHQAVIEKLLLSGLDHYFAGQYERAIQVWTRVFFLDRNHARARAYIERARSAVAERHRESDELLAGGLTALSAGDAQRARDLLTSAVDRGGSEVEALAALDRLNRLTASTGGSAGHVEVSESTGRPAPVARAFRVGVVPQAVLVAAAVILLSVAAWLVLDWKRVSSWWLGTPSAQAVAAPVTSEPLPLPDPSALLLARARTLYRRGAFDEALVALERMPPGEPRSREATALRAEIQRAVLRTIPDRTASGPVPGDR